MTSSPKYYWLYFHILFCIKNTFVKVINYFSWRWAHECIEKFGLSEHERGANLKLKDALKGPLEIYKGSKAGHLKTISKKTGIPLSQMIFYDNEYGNCQTVAGVGVTVMYTPVSKILKKYLFILISLDLRTVSKLLLKFNRMVIRVSLSTGWDD